MIDNSNDDDDDDNHNVHILQRFGLGLGFKINNFNRPAQK
jgi:hypothetical protein